MFILSVFAYLSCAMKDGALGELSMGSSQASLHLVPHQSDRQQSGGLMTQACCGNTVLPFPGTWSLFLYNLACQSTDDSSFLDNVYFIRISSLPVTIFLSGCCFQCVRSSFLSQTCLICWPSWLWESFALTLMADAHMKMLMNMFLD